VYSFVRPRLRAEAVAQPMQPVEHSGTDDRDIEQFRIKSRTVSSLPAGVDPAVVWVHHSCREAWWLARQAQAAALASVGIGP